MALLNPREELIIRILDVDGVEERKSRFGNASAFFVGSREIAHFHSAHEIDIRLMRAEKTRLKDKLAKDERVDAKASVDWVVFQFRTMRDVKHAAQLVAIAARANRT